ncbi:hypothetical protein [Burkholderia perseverans]|uniref:hypothetical protein n=1 Tax=Burkholderia perseverans TaxID=2615214 RepID=UPI001FEEEC38|nr:hypothetical protein [Burkholderia perseverans]
MGIIRRGLDIQSEFRVLRQCVLLIFRYGRSGFPDVLRHAFHGSMLMKLRCRRRFDGLAGIPAGGSPIHVDRARAILLPSNYGHANFSRHLNRTFQSFPLPG